jgi:16S rRNA U516 pseudouridylate synthase RsuA-like enzyme
MEKNTGTRINKYLSEVGYCSRRAADKLLEQDLFKKILQAIVEHRSKNMDSYGRLD